VQVQVRHNPASTVARCYLQPGEPLRVEAGAMLAHSAGVHMQSKAEGGVMAGLKRSMLAGESFFVTTYTAPQQGGWVDVAPALDGDAIALPITPERPFFLSRGSWLASSYGVEVQSKWGGMANFFGGEGGWGLRAEGNGEVVLGVYGAIDVVDLQPGEVVTVDTGHVVAYDLNTQFIMRRSAQGKSLQSMKSGEGFVFDFTGPARVLLQTRNPGAFVSWIQTMLPNR
jgi:uncharacterized protein (TIGR00266 family)